MSPEAARILKYLVDRISEGTIRANRQNTYPTYGQVHSSLGLEQLGQTIGQSLVNQGLGELAQFMKDNRLPAITGLVVDQTTSRPGGDFFRVYERTPEDFQWWMDQCESALAHDWSQLIDQYYPSYRYPDQIDEQQPYLEGSVNQIKVNAYERDPAARAACLHQYGYNCSVCSISFETKYGEIGKGFIHVHHLKPLSSIRQQYTVDPIQDLRPVCPNCHAMLHRSGLSIDELREKLT